MRRTYLSKQLSVCIDKQELPIFELASAALSSYLDPRRNYTYPKIKQKYKNVKQTVTKVSVRYLWIVESESDGR